MTDADKLRSVLQIGAKMRAAQKDYFATRGRPALIRSKQLEREFDFVVGAAARDDMFFESQITAALLNVQKIEEGGEHGRR